MTEVMITGITSFHGKHLAREFLKRGYNISGLARYVSNRDIELKDVSIYLGDIRDYYDLRGVFERVSPDILIHLAAQTPVEYSFSHESEVLDVNFLGTVNVTRLAKEYLPNLKKFVFASSVEVYGNQKHFPISEDQPINPASPYAVAKTSSETYLNYLHRGYGFPCIILRTTNTYGRERSHTFVIEHIIHDMLVGKKIIPMGIPDSVRDFLYVDDEVDAYVKLIESENSSIIGETFNTGTGVGTSIRELFHKIYQKIGVECRAEWRKISHRPYEIQKLIINSSKLRNAVGWRPKYSLDEGLDKTIVVWREWLASG